MSRKITPSDLAGKSNQEILDIFYHNDVREKVKEAQSRYNTVFTFSGTGGSSCKVKPNLSTLTCLYMTYWEDTLILKAGSESKKRKGSSQFMREICLTTFQEIVQLENFLYIDTTSAFLNNASNEGLLEDKKIKQIVDKADLYDQLGARPTHRITGVLNDFCAELYMKKMPLPTYDCKQIFVFGKLEDIEVDEITFPIFYECDSEMNIVKHDFSDSLVYSYNEDENISGLLLHGTISKNSIFYKSLQLSFAYASHFIGKTETINEGMELFEKIYENRYLIKRFGFK